MRLRAMLPGLAVAAAVGIWVLPGCQQKQQHTEPPAQAVEEPTTMSELPSAAELGPEEEPGLPDLEPGEEPETEGGPLAGGEPPAGELSIDPDREYDSRDLDRLRGVLVSAEGEYQAKARRLLEELLLHSNVASTRQMAATILGAAPEESVEALTRAALNDPESDVRAAAVASLGEARRSPELMEALARLQEAQDARIRQAAIMSEISLRLKDKVTREDHVWIERLLGRRKDDASAQLQIQLVQRGAKSLPPLFEVLESSPNPVARQAAGCCISLICAGTNERQQEFAELAHTVKKEVIREPEPAILDGVKPLERALDTDADPIVRAMAAQGLGYLGQESSAPLLGEALHDDNEEVRWWAALALVTVPAEAAVEDLAEAATKDPSMRVREAAVRALGWVEDERVVMPLIRATADDASRVRQAAASELSRVRSDVALQALLTLFDDPNEDVRWAAVLAVGKLRNPESTSALAKAMRDPSPMVANAAERALQRMGVAERRFGTREEM
ncbi:MAG: HEAT repeat domain-containing protein [Armatimonadota bacterium]|nr:HEAT repeat domain-containing protein [Armatimonadota bacterium]